MSCSEFGTSSATWGCIASPQKDSRVCGRRVVILPLLLHRDLSPASCDLAFITLICFAAFASHFLHYIVRTTDNLTITGTGDVTYRDLEIIRGHLRASSS